MQILNAAIREDLSRGVGLRLNLGSGGSRRDGYYGVDLLPLSEVDITADLNEPLTELPDASVEAIHTRHTLEHVKNLLGLMRELHRVCRPGAELDIIVPHFSNPYYYSDPTHERFFGLYTMFYFSEHDERLPRRVPAFYSDARFTVESVTIKFYRRTWFDKLTVPIVSRLVNRGYRMMDLYERRLCWLLHAHELRYRLRCVK